MTILHEWLFKRRHKRDCASNLARDLAMIGVEKRERERLSQRELMLATTRAIRAAKGLPPSPALKTGR